jgi:hypothetical protein
LTLSVFIASSITCSFGVFSSRSGLDFIV